MTRIIYLPNENSLNTLDSKLTPDDLVIVVNRGLWHPPDAVSPVDDEPKLRAVRLGRQTVLIFRSVDLDRIPSEISHQGPLSERQIAVLNCLAQGMTTRQISARLKIARRTVYLHMAAIRNHLRAMSTAEAVRRASELGLCQPPISGRWKSPTD